MQYTPYLKWSNMPVIILAIAGDRLVVSAAIFTNKIYTEELLSVTLRPGSNVSANVQHVAQVFLAIDNSMVELRGLYARLPAFLALPPPRPAMTALWPNPTADPLEPTKHLPELEYFAKVNCADGTPLLHIDTANESHAMYLARMPIQTPTQGEKSYQDVFVKFVPDYHEPSHRILADQSPPMAPALHFCGRVIGDMYMVVTEYTPESAGRSIGSRFPAAGPPLPPDFPAIIERDVSKALALLHGEGFVLGDLQELDLLYMPGSDGGRVLLVNFEGAGLYGEARYSTLTKGPRRGRIVEREDDFENLEGILQKLREDCRSQLIESRPEERGPCLSETSVVQCGLSQGPPPRMHALATILFLSFFFFCLHHYFLSPLPFSFSHLFSLHPP